MENMIEKTIKAHLATTKINISGLTRFYSYCKNKVVSSDIIEFKSDSDESIESDYKVNKDKDDKNPSKIDKLAFVKMHNAIPNTAKMHLRLGKIVENVLFYFAKDMKLE
ncbi:hypothetical protein C1645_821343 [Glomus cerebriforme]|uniref:Uncharacterized protein n=1 Tax=Glomus cerebriforme TaxID=658196 RepID=A0A397T1D6_9GLOM|nr:hypothetical protein C1645_821343 [Glomus cerebriforme]